MAISITGVSGGSVSSADLGGDVSDFDAGDDSFSSAQPVTNKAEAATFADDFVSYDSRSFQSFMGTTDSTTDSTAVGATSSSDSTKDEPMLPQPEKGATAPEYGEVKGTAFSGKVDAGNVSQGSLSDCWVVAPLSSLAQRDPEAIKKNIQEKDDGSYDVTLYDKQKDGTFKPTVENVTAAMPVDAKGEQVYATSNDGAQWPAIYEKAIAQHAGGYDKLDEGAGGDPGDQSQLTAMETLTGKPAERTPVNPSSADAIYTRLQDAQTNGKLTTASTYSDDEDLAKALKQNGSSASTLAQLGLTGGHEYTVLGVGQDANGARSITLRNPQGEQDGRANQNGVFTMPFDQFTRQFQQVHTGGGR